MKIQSIIFALIFLVLSPCIVLANTEETGHETRHNMESESEQEPIDTEILNAYRSILDQCINGLDSGWSHQDYYENGLNYMFGYYHSTNDIGYYLKDLDTNGTPELFIGPFNQNEKMFFSMYSFADDEPILVADSAERNRFYLCEDNTIANEGSGGVSVHGNSYYKYQDGQLFFIESVLYDSVKNQDEPWFYENVSKDGDFDKHLSEKEAFEIIKGYVYAEIPYVFLEDYESHGISR